MGRRLVLPEALATASHERPKWRGARGWLAFSVAAPGRNKFALPCLIDLIFLCHIIHDSEAGIQGIFRPYRPELLLAQKA